ncbi:MAG: FeoA domain-containing protein [Candidatus Schekmanbacteria bacterium]|nr:FeoA domain-containing protein [Candidatus Schekmanbacteria bacterium]
MGPLAALCGVILLTTAAAWLFRPIRGRAWRWLRLVQKTERVLIEDALKHLYDCEFRRAPCTLQSLSGALEISRNHATALLGRLEGLDLVNRSNGSYRLATAGRREALRVVRIHRLWERYLAEETGYAAEEWHIEAEHREHETSAAEAEEMALRLSFPRYDPHGAPIPTPSGEIGPAVGMPLTQARLGDVVEVVHMEDEPEAIYGQLLAEGVHLGMRLRLLESTPHSLRFEADEEEHVLAPIIAANVSVVPIVMPVATEPARHLSDLSRNEEARVVALSPACRGIGRRRLLDLGFVPGTLVRVENMGPGGDPVALRVRGALIALRRDQARFIHVTAAEKGVAA